MFSDAGWFYLVVVNLVSFAVFGADKGKAKRNAWRIPEKTLLGLAALGGGPGAWIGMYVFHHKTRKLKFSLGVPLITILEYGIFYAFFFQ